MFLRRLSMILVLLGVAAVPAAAVPDFTFIQISDVHVGAGSITAQSGPTIATIRDWADIAITPYDVTVPKPSFVIATGDLTEFGGGRGVWEEYLSNFQNFPIPVYDLFGNHDNTWCALRFKNRAVYGQDWYSFDYSGCHFVMLDTASLQDPRPSFGWEQLLWLKQDLAKVGPATPVFLAWHHPLPSGEMASPYDWDRVLDIIRPYNVVLMMDGHGHTGLADTISRVDRVEGGSTYGPNLPGYNVISVKGNTLRVAYCRVNETDKWKALLEKPIPSRSSYPRITITGLADRQVITGPVSFGGAILGGDPIQTATMQIDDDEDLVINLTRIREQFIGRLDPTGLRPGAHYLRLSFAPAQGDPYQRSLSFYVDSGAIKPTWRTFLGGSSRCTPTVAGGRVYVGANDGALYALDAATGALIWRFETKAEIMGQPLVVAGSIFFGNGDGKLFCLDLGGQQRWVFTTTSDTGPWPVYGTPVWADGLVLVGANDGAFYALDAVTGEQRWANREASYTIESRPWVQNGVVYYTAWDQYVYAVNIADGSLKWKCRGVGSEEATGAKAYYSPADGHPVLAGGKIWVADRAYKLSIIDAQTGRRVGRGDSISQVGVSEDRQSVYLRSTDGPLIKVNAVTGAVVWSADCGLNVIPSAPMEQGGMVYVSSARGLVSAVNAADGSIAWQYQATPRLYVMSDLTVANGLACISGLDGSLTALPAAAASQDTTPPVITCTNPTVSAGADCTAPCPAVATATDDTDSHPLVTQNPALGTKLSPGPHSVTATATDQSGNSSFCTAVVTVVDRTPPTLTCANPTVSVGTDGTAPCPSVATATDNCAGVTVTQTPIAGAPLAPGSYTVNVVATDAAGNAANCTATVTVLEKQPPVVAITSPLAGDVLTGTVTTIAATASDPNGPITSVEFFLDGMSIGTDSTAPYTAPPLDTTLYANGTHAIEAKATSANGSAWTYVSVKFGNTLTGRPVLAFSASKVSWDAGTRRLVMNLKVTNNGAAVGAVTINSFAFIGTYLDGLKLVSVSIPATPVVGTLPANLGNLATGASASLDLEATIPPAVTKVGRFIFSGQFIYGGNMYYF